MCQNPSKVSWPSLIVTMVEVKQRLAHVDEGLWPHHLPDLAATDLQLCEVEQRLFFRLPQSYREFLRHANGWKGFFQNTDMLSCEALVGGVQRDYFRKVYGSLDEQEWHALGLQFDQLLPIAINLLERDVFVLDLRSLDERDCKVVWLAGQVVDQWPTFIEFFASMIEYNRLEIEHFAKEK